MHYNQTVDIWSVGCIMAELITSKTLFPGADRKWICKSGLEIQLFFCIFKIDIDQLLRIMTVCGTPDEEFMKKITSEEARNYIRTLPTMKKRNYKEIFRDANPEGKVANDSIF